jgi:hypothetical protein
VVGTSLFRALLKGARRPPIDLLELGMKIGDPLFGGFVAGFLIGALEPGSPGFLVGLR